MEKEIKLITLKNNQGTEVKITNYGGIIKEFNYDNTNIVRSKDLISDYKNGNAYMGALIGRVANRIGKGTFKIDEQIYHIPINNGPNTNHGGLEGFDSKVWDIKEIKDNKLVLTLKSDDGEEGFPGNVFVTASYYLNDDNQLEITLEAVSDAVTPINLSTHSYFNLNGEGSIKEHLLKVNSNRITSSDENLLPTGDIEDISDTALDFTEFKPINSALQETENTNIINAKGLDHNYIFSEDLTDSVVEMAELRGDKYYLKVYSNQPGLQIYSGNFLDEEGAGGTYYNNYDGVAMEPQNWPDAVNHSNFPNSLISPGEKYKVKIIYEVGNLN